MARERRRQKDSYFDEVDNHERWVISYADFVTLLFAFFLVMYSISSVNENKYKDLSNALENAFNQVEKKTEEPVVIDMVETTETSLEPIVVDHKVIEEQKQEQEQDRALSEEILKERRLLKQVSEQLQIELKDYISDDSIAVIRNDFWVELQMNSQLLFSIGEATLSTKAIPILKKVAEMVKPIENVINVEGHTDNIPIENSTFSSNWELSSARATSVVREFINNGVLPKRLSAVGYGEHHPVADNDSEQGRSQNRRVVLVLMSQAFSRYGMSDEERAKLLNLDTSSAKEMME